MGEGGVSVKLEELSGSCRSLCHRVKAKGTRGGMARSGLQVRKVFLFPGHDRLGNVLTESNQSPKPIDSLSQPTPETEKPEEADFHT